MAGTELELHDVSMTYPGTVPVRALRPVSLRIVTGEMTAIIGRSGSGKSTLLNILGLLDRPTAGRYLVRDIDTTTLPESAITALRGRQFGFVFQSFHLLPDRSAAENTELSLLYQRIPRRERRRRAVAALKRVGLPHRIDAMPGTMSGGERQRVAIARALAQQPRVLLCDEPTGNLDRANADLVVEMLETLNAEGLTIIIVTHDPQVAHRMSRRLHIDDGVVTESVRGAR
ncbi:Lipoprotein-releasing system ATP-binding protein LolD [Actinomadura rubteroloni]|uniref:Lipoprotein-releasing system ATP-binding protein LolD n=2 Tax=Actinomadura rubteroloni TaxID=1926885 RepID=A0A2P4UKF4_9ACTN|nr:Lipoprotein-releasing system ATP-binding protein LolD [Actinomadura rubteroloni]